MEWLRGLCVGGEDGKDREGASLLLERAAWRGLQGEPP
jgi:hypothetical protein